MNNFESRINRIETQLNKPNFQLLTNMYFEQPLGKSLLDCIKEVNKRTGLKLKESDIAKQYNCIDTQFGKIFHPKGWSHDEFILSIYKNQRVLK